MDAIGACYLQMVFHFMRARIATYSRSAPKVFAALFMT